MSTKSTYAKAYKVPKQLEAQYWCTDRFSWFAVGQGVYLDGDKRVYFRVMEFKKELVRIGYFDLVGLVARWVSPDRLAVAELNTK